MNDDAHDNPLLFHDLSYAVIPQAKITDYLLNPVSRDGAGKAKFFHERGFRLDDWEELSRSLLAHGNVNPVEKYVRNEYGLKIVVRCNLLSPDGKDPCIRSVWMQEDGELPRFVTAYPSD